MEDTGRAEIVAEAAEAAAEETVDAISTAASINDDPVVGEVLQDAAMKAQTTTGRVGWLRGFINRLMGRPSV